MPGENREILFPEGVPVRMLDGLTRKRLCLPRLRLSRATHRGERGRRRPGQ